MSYDRIWIERKEYPGGWLERGEAESKNLNEEFYADYSRLHAQGHGVVLLSG
jgi:hypothetical protein